MENRNPPPWLVNRGPPQRPPAQPSNPAKRFADSRAPERPSKRSNNSTTAQEEAWVADEDKFVLQQAKKKAALRVRGGRATPIDWLAVTLRFIDPTKSLLDDEVEDGDLEVLDPEGVLADLGEGGLAELEKDIDHYLALETNRANREYWNALKVVCKDRRRKFDKSATEARGTSSVAADIDKILSPKTHEQLEVLEGQVKRKLDSDEPIDYDYWEQLLRTLRVFKAKAKLRKVSQEIISERLEVLRKEQHEAALALQRRLIAILGLPSQAEPTTVQYDAGLDPESALRLRADDKSLDIVDHQKFINDIVAERRRVLKLGYVPPRNQTQRVSTTAPKREASHPSAIGLSRFAPVDTEDCSQATQALYDREVARGVEEGEEIFTAEEELTKGNPLWASKYKPRKPRYFNRVQMGYEWNKYNQTHYDHDNPPPKVVQGYKFNIFYPDLIDKSQAPTYHIERENGRKKGQSIAPAGEDDTCLVRFIAGAPYEDIAFRIVDKEWDYSAKSQRGFISSFDKGILQLHFQFKKIYYRK